MPIETPRPSPSLGDRPRRFVIRAAVRMAALLGIVFLGGATSVAASLVAGDLVIQNVRVFTGSEVIERASLFVEGETIRAVVPTLGSTPPPRLPGGGPGPGLSGGGPLTSAGLETLGAPGPAGGTAITVIDGTGLTAVPGLIDAHVHLIAGTAGPSEAQNLSYVQTQLPARLEAYLSHGVTTVKSMGDPTLLTVGVAADLRAGALNGPRVLTTGAVLTPPGGIPVNQFCFGDPWCLSQIVLQVGTPAEAMSRVDELAAAGVDAIKLVNDSLGGAPLMPPSLMQAIVSRAHAHGLRATGHSSPFEAEALALANAGVDGIEHMIATPLSGPALAQALLANNASYTTTLTQRQATLPPTAFADVLSNTAALHAAGVRIVVGTDTLGTVPEGQTTLAELLLLVQAGLSPAEALRAATVLAADHLGRRDLGRLEVGAQADILLVSGNPLDDIQDIQNTVRVIQGGRVVSP